MPGVCAGRGKVNSKIKQVALCSSVAEGWDHLSAAGESGRGVGARVLPVQAWRRPETWPVTCQSIGVYTCDGSTLLS